VCFGRLKDIQTNGHRAGFAEGDTSRSRLSKWIGRGMRRRALLWDCESENAVYHVATTSDERAPLAPEVLRVICCKEMQP
jgi:hypothetical protein